MERDAAPVAGGADDFARRRRSNLPVRLHAVEARARPRVQAESERRLPRWTDCDPDHSESVARYNPLARRRSCMFSTACVSLGFGEGRPQFELGGGEKLVAVGRVGDAVELTPPTK